MADIPDRDYFATWRVDLALILEAILSKLTRLESAMATVREELDNLATRVTSMQGAVTSAEEVLTELAQMVRDAAGDATRVRELADAIDLQATSLAQAVASNDPTPAPPPGG